MRKYAFYLVMAAHLYHKCGQVATPLLLASASAPRISHIHFTSARVCAQRGHAVRCYNSAMKVFEGRKWYHVEDHINYNLGGACRRRQAGAWVGPPA